MICILFILLVFMPMHKHFFVFAKQDSDAVFLPVIMYHNVLKSRNGRYIVSPKQLEDDIVALKEAGYESVFPSEVLKYAKGECNLPQKPILITFDDGRYNNYHYALPLFEKYGFKGVINIVGAYTDYTTSTGDISNPNYSHLTWEQIEQMCNSGHFEVGNHTYNMHKLKPRYGIGQIKGECDSDYFKALTEDIGKLQTLLKTKSHINTNVFAYPFGKFSQKSEQALKGLGFEVIFTCTEGVNVIKRGNPEKLIRLKRYNREGDWSTKKLLATLNKGVAVLASTM